MDLILISFLVFLSQFLIKMVNSGGFKKLFPCVDIICFLKQMFWETVSRNLFHRVYWALIRRTKKCNACYSQRVIFEIKCAAAQHKNIGPVIALSLYLTPMSLHSCVCCTDNSLGHIFCEPFFRFYVKI